MKRGVITLVIAIAALLLSFLLDSYVVHFFTLIQHPILNLVMHWFSHGLTVFTILIVLAAFFLYQDKKTAFILVLVASFVIALISSETLKQLFMRVRPIGYETHILGFGNAQLTIGDYSYPSSHTSCAFSVLPVLDKEFNKMKVFWIVFAIMVAISRMYLGMHYLSDVIAGAILGYMIGQVIVFMEEKYGIAKRFFS